MTRPVFDRRFVLNYGASRQIKEEEMLPTIVHMILTLAAVSPLAIYIHTQTDNAFAAGWVVFVAYLSMAIITLVVVPLHDEDGNYHPWSPCRGIAGTTTIMLFFFLGAIQGADWLAGGDGGMESVGMRVFGALEMTFFLALVGVMVYMQRVEISNRAADKVWVEGTREPFAASLLWILGILGVITTGHALLPIVAGGGLVLLAILWRRAHHGTRYQAQNA